MMPDDEISTAYYIFTDAGIDVDLATIQGGETSRNYDAAAQNKLAHTLPIKQIPAENYEAVYLIGAHEAIIEFSENQDLAQLITTLYAQGSIIGAVCHGTAGLLSALKKDGSPLVEGLHVNSFTNEEERAVPQHNTLPFLLETRLRELGAIFESSIPFKTCVVQEGQLVTGQNAASAQGVAETIAILLKQNTMDREKSKAA